MDNGKSGIDCMRGDEGGMKEICKGIGGRRFEGCSLVVPEFYQGGALFCFLDSPLRLGLKKISSLFTSFEMPGTEV